MCFTHSFEPGHAFIIVFLASVAFEADVDVVELPSFVVQE